MEPTRPPIPPPWRLNPSRLTTAEELLAPVNAEYAALLAAVHGKGAPRRFLEAVRERPHGDNPDTFTEADLDAFFRSLDGALYPSCFTDDAGMRRIWSHFWEARTASFAAVLRRLIDETLEKHNRRIDPTADAAELQVVERALTRAFLRADRARLRTFVGRRGVELVDLAYALWTSHADGWFNLATAPQVLPLIGTLLRGDGYTDGVERARPSADFGAHRPSRIAERTPQTVERRRTAATRSTSAAGGMKPYQALFGGKTKSSNK